MPWSNPTGWTYNGVFHPPGPKRWVNDIGRTRVSFSNVENLIRYYCEARSLYSKEMSARYAIHSCERTWHTGSRISLDQSSKRSWKKSTRIDASLNRLLTVLSNTLHAKITVAQLEFCFRKKQTIQELVVNHLSLNRPRFFRDSEVAADNYYRIFGDQTEVQRLTLLYKFVNDAWARKSWKRIKRGRDLFVLWPFDIRRALSVLNPYGMYLPNDVIGRGYGTTNPYKFSADRYYRGRNEYNREATREYLLRWQEWFKEDNHIGQLDELPRQAEMIRANMHVHPRRLMRIEAQIREEEIARWNRSQKPVDPEHKYEWTYGYTEKVNYKYGLFPIRTYKQLTEASTALHNCAAGYHYRIDNEECLLVVAVDLQDEKIIALGEYRPKDKVWVQISGPCNAPIDEEVRQLYLSYTKEQ